MDIHIVDDDRTTLLFYSKVAHSCGFSSASFDSPEKYLQSMAVDGYCPPVLILSDIDMAGKNGYQLMREVRKINSDQRFIIASSTTDVDSGKDHACLYYTKPVPSDSLRAAFSALFQCHDCELHPRCMRAEACVPDNRSEFKIDCWRCPHITS